MNDNPGLFERIAEASQKVEAEIRGKVIITENAAADAVLLREELDALKDEAENARDNERLPLVAKIHEILGRYAPHLLALKQAHDLVRHSLRSWDKRQKTAAKERAS